MIHAWLMKNVSWYRKWHKYRYCQLVHAVVFILFASGTIYLTYQLQEIIFMI